MSDKCHICDRAKARRMASFEDWKESKEVECYVEVTMYRGEYFNDCFSKKVDWRARCLAAEALQCAERAAERGIAMVEVERVLNDRKGFHVENLDKETRDDLLGAIVDAVLM